MPERDWQRSSFCAGGGNNCVEVAAAGAGGVAIRESESPDAVLVTSRVALRALVLGVKTGHSEIG
ncbi:MULTISPECIES: DUF397 domain-containing protein [unclassified Streptomyces]|uniref:DUF397 domain-containing protein n=1 Tax=unclassified Streptomyces TaxID=2593676 RepID=UPI00224CD5D1|nr:MULTISPECIES: DUF397 domain-containing protein [unclassified Streptomyces]WSP53087.1 DUF397 domain-containing protein [Streptomyces sp. NBC_01241]WSU26195.1 DUF397 domain-containing protein [Streptomyces sp. NBC_01108]MCX4799413.1 DUF397 domain-containing protein [Streptomyces sp. NBC_01242]WSJ40717.1 DUF397 domain-containing protein [Streptomyces sp. NBC_01321]WSP67075.1 DUF397 domain-containing protein [Streptomyces sp. NBC_01240]